MDKLIINVCSRQRAGELGLLLQSLRTQTYQNFDIYLLEDDQEGKSFMDFYFIQMLVIRLKLEGHKVFYERTPFNFGVSKSRQYLVDKSLEKGYDYTLRLDDDVIIENDYIERLMKLTDKYDIISGVTPPLTPSFIRDSDKINIADEFIIDQEGNIKLDMDDCGVLYTGEKVVDCHHFRSCALIKRAVHEKVSYNSRLSKHGFREETLFSLKALIEGFKIGVDLQAKAWHLNCPSGGERFQDQQQLAIFNLQQLKDWVKEHKEEILKVLPSRELTKEEINKDNNMAK